ncbi:MAG: beta-ketoacyl-ACP synthase III [Planctomycetota bacterium]|jgi:3-oxoacyl-[acyl-carrier-protein] synthase-3
MQSFERLPVEIVSLGTYLPQRLLTNAALEQMVDTSSEWIVQRTGINERHIAAEAEATSDLAAAAARGALEAAGMEPEELDALLVATCTPDHLFPATACLVQAAIGADNAMACDLEAACSGFLFGLSWAGGMITSGMVSNAMLIGAETLSRVTDYTDRRSCILFGDAAGAAILRRSENGGEVLSMELGADGSCPEILCVPAGGSRTPATHQTVEQRDHYMHLEGREVFRQAVNKLVDLLQRVPEQAGVDLDEIRMVIPHQSNARIVKSCLERVGLGLDKAYMNIDRVGNTSAASIPLAMAEAVQRGELERGDLVLLLAFGGGMTWGSVLIRY